MSFSGGIFFTNKGRALQAKAQAGAQLNFTRIGIGDGQLAGQDISELTALINQVKSLTVTRFRVLTGGKASVGGILTNEGLVTGFYWREIGLFATDPDLGEILYCYGNAGALAEYIPAGGGSEILEKQVAIVSIIGNAANVSATIDQTLIWASQQDLLLVQNDFAAHLANYVRNPGFASTAGVANAYTVATIPALPALVDGVSVYLDVHADNTGASTLNWDGKGAKDIVDSKGLALTAGKLKANTIIGVRYNASAENFQLLGEGGGGTALAADILATKTATVDSGLVTGTMPNRGAVNITPGTAAQIIAQGYHDGAGTVIGDTDLVTGNIKAGTNIFGVAGKTEVVDTTEAANPITAANVLSPKVGYVNGAKITGTMVDRGTVNITPGTANQAIAAGKHSGAGVVYGDADLIAANIKSGKNIFNVVGTLVPEDASLGSINIAPAHSINHSYTLVNISGQGTLLLVRSPWSDGAAFAEFEIIVDSVKELYAYAKRETNDILFVPFNSSLVVKSNNADNSVGYMLY